MNDIIQFHIDHKYYVDVKSIPSMTGCMVSFPSNSFLEQPESHITYLIENKPLRIEMYDLEEGTDIDVRKINVTRSCARILILEDILLRTLKRKIAQCLIVVDKSKNKNVFDALALEMDTGALTLEKELLLKFRELILGKVENDILNDELAEGYRLILNCFENGGL